MGNILLARLAAWLGGGLGGSAWLKYGARVAQSSSSSGRVGYNDEISGGACGLPLASMKLILHR